MPAPRQQEPVLIVGGGIGGLAAALALARKGFRVQVFEQAPEFKEIGAGIQLGPNVFRMFEVLGITDAINRDAVFPDGLLMRDSITGEEVTRVPLDDRFRRRFKYPYAVTHRADLHRAILEACARNELIELKPSQKVVDIDERPDGAGLRTEDGTTWRGSALIGCDGIWSLVRARVVDDGKPIVSGHIAYRAVIPAAEMPEHLRLNTMVLWAGEKTHFVHYPLRRGELFNLVAVFHSNRYEEGWDSFGDPAELQQRFADKCAEVRTLLNKIESWRMWVLCDRTPIREWSRGRIGLLGDAAHPMLQYLAQGACMAIEDAVCLANEAEKARGDFAAAFRAYQQARYLRTGRVQIMARVYGEFYHASGVARELRNMMLGSRTPDEAAEAMEWLYGEQLHLAATDATPHAKAS